MGKRRASGGGHEADSRFYIIVTPSRIRRVLIPPEFMRRKKMLNENSKSMSIMLEGPFGDTWDVRLRHEEGAGTSYLEQGWQDFCRHHSLGNSEFLAFKYNDDDDDGNKAFRVTIFEPSGLERTTPPN